jgi:hypothetical protein
MINTLGLLSLVLSAVITAQPLDNPAITPLSTTEVNDFNSYTYFASAAYSPPSEIDTWSCGGKSAPYLKVILTHLTRPKLLVEITRTLNILLPAEMGIPSSTVRQVYARARMAPENCQGMLGTHHH